MVEFTALIKEFKIKSLVSLDKEAKLILVFPGCDVELLNKINALHKADETVKVSIGKDNG